MPAGWIDVIDVIDVLAVPCSLIIGIPGECLPEETPQPQHEPITESKSGVQLLAARLVVPSAQTNGCCFFVVSWTQGTP